MSNYAISLKRTSLLLAALTFTALLLVVNFASFFSKADAAQLSNRSLTLSSTLGGSETGDLVQGSETNGSDAIHTITFTKSATSISSILLQYCDDPLDLVCTAPDAVLDVSTAVITSSQLASISSGTATDNTREFSFTPEATAEAVTLVLTGVVNPDVVGTFFIRISTHSDSDPDAVGMADREDDGAVASSITEGIVITARVKETLGFSTTGDVEAGIVAPTAACVPLTGSGAITLGDTTENALALDETFFNYSAFRTYTNALNGMSITYNGSTLTSGTNNIDPIGTNVNADAEGTDEQFGLAADGVVGGNAAVTINSRTATGDFTNANLLAAWDTPATAGELVVGADYDGGGGTIPGGSTAFTFIPDAATQIASNDGYVNCVTVPIRYIANIEPLTAPGVYTTTIVYTAIPQY